MRPCDANIQVCRKYTNPPSEVTLFPSGCESLTIEMMWCLKNPDKYLQEKGFFGNNSNQHCWYCWHKETTKVTDNQLFIQKKACDHKTHHKIHVLKTTRITISHKDLLSKSMQHQWISSHSSHLLYIIRSRHGRPKLIKGIKSFLQFSTFSLKIWLVLYSVIVKSAISTVSPEVKGTHEMKSLRW